MVDADLVNVIGHEFGPSFSRLLIPTSTSAALSVPLQLNLPHSLISAFLRDCLIHSFVSAASKVFHFNLRELSGFDED